VSTVEDLRERVDAAAKLWSRSAELVQMERALFSLQGCFPGHDADSVLLKVVALACVWANRTVVAQPWAAHARRVLARFEPGVEPLWLVDELARAPGVALSAAGRAVTFASRFAHYFVDVDRFPVLDRWSEVELARLAPPTDGASRYVEFAARHSRVASELGIERPRRLWCYLWLAGQHRAWSRNPRTTIHGAARALFECGAPALASFAGGAPAPRVESRRAVEACDPRA
jgi:hypothetical protein